MGILETIHGSVFTTEREIIAHGVNCRGGFGSGVAGQIAKLYPEVRRAYLRKHESDGWKLGQVQYVMVDGGKIIANMATQDTYGQKGVHVNYDAVRSCFERLLNFAETEKKGIAMPRIGAGLAGGDWEKIEEILADEVGKRDVEVDVYVL